MAKDFVTLTFAVADNPHVAAIKSGAIAISGVAPEFADVKPQIAAYRRMVRDLEFDVCELAPTTYVIARAFGAPLGGKSLLICGTIAAVFWLVFARLLGVGLGPAFAPLGL